MREYQDEKDLLIKLKAAKIRLEAAKAEKAAAEIEFDRLEAIIVEELTEKSAKTTAKYDGIGYVTLLKPLVRAEYDKNNEQELFAFVSEKGEGDLIKLTIHPQSLYGFVGRCLDRGDVLPPFLEYWLQPSIRCMFGNIKASSTKEE